ncbi:uncharacterized protein LOC103524116 [Trichonephila clavipes]|nr:uncharacterized protein LOC103524116 [Trichonephila clavipes]
MAESFPTLRVRRMGQKIYENCTKCNLVQATPDHLLFCAGLEREDIYSSPLLVPTLFPGHLRYASAHLPVHKHNSLLAELRSTALATIHERYPDQDWLHVFTDGSATTPFGRAGAGAFSNSFNLKEPLSAWSDSLDGKIYAIFMALRAISTTPGLNIVISIDSQAAIKTVSGYNLFPSKLEFECKQLINSFLCTGREVVLQWIPSHCGIHGNEQADKLAKEAWTLHPPCHPMPL